MTFLFETLVNIRD